VGALGDVARDFVEVKVHHVGVSVGQHEDRPDAAGRPRRKGRRREEARGSSAKWPPPVLLRSNQRTRIAAKRY
jgi:hypothetical protein